MLELDAGLVLVGANYLFVNSKKEIIGGHLYDDTASSLKAVLANIADGSRTFYLKGGSFGEQRLVGRPGKYINAISRISSKYSWFNELMFVSAKRNEEFFITSYAHRYVDFWNILMSKFDLPIKEDWSEYIFEKCIQNGYMEEGHVFYQDKAAVVDMGLMHIEVADVLVYGIEGISEEKLEAIISNGLKMRDIYIAEKDISKVIPLDLGGGLGDYMNRYSETIIANISDSLHPLSGLRGAVANFAVKNLKPLPPQATCVSGIVELSKKSNYGFMVEEMGTGKTLQAIAVVESKFNTEYLARNKGAKIEDCFVEGNVRYRVIIMAPSHLVYKWKEEIESNVYNPRITILDSNSGITVLDRIRNKEPAGREFYIISMTQAKIEYPKMPLPSVERSGSAELNFCKYCFEELNEFNLMPYGGKCKKCGGADCKIQYKRYEPSEEYIEAPKGMECPECKRLLIRPVNSVSKFVDTPLDELFLTSTSFAKHTENNHRCFHCGASLWQPAVKLYDNNRPPKWVKFKHFKNFKQNSVTMDFVLRKKAEEIYYSTPSGLRIGSIEESIEPIKLKNRRVSIASYIKKYIKFDMCILDEAHKYEGEGTGQAQAAHHISSASKFTLCLTGTLLNGKANSIFHLLYMLDPKRMNDYGYDYGDSHEFAKEYGTVETEYEYSDDSGDVEYKTSCKGRMLKASAVKPGISPMLYTDFLLDKCVMLNLTDLSQFMPNLIEKVVPVDLEADIACMYRDMMGQLKSAVRTTEGRSVLGSIFTLGLSYPDKPYDKKDIVSSYTKGAIVCEVPNIEEYRDMISNKEAKLIEIVREEISQNRNMFVFCSNTGKGEYKVTGKLKKVIEENCGLRGSVEVIETGKPDAKDRYDYIKKRASEGVRVFICNYKQVETGVDFSFSYQGVRYNYPTIIFYQIGNELASVWQASGRAYRLNQTEECHTYFLGYKGTMQMDAIELFAEKKAAVSAIQGKFTSEGIAAMAKGVDERMRLMEALSNEVGAINVENIENMFEVLNSSSTDENVDSELLKEYNSALRLEDIVVEENEKISNLITMFSFNTGEDDKDSNIVDSVVTKEETIEENIETTALSKAASKKQVVSKNKKKKTSDVWDVFKVIDLLNERSGFYERTIPDDKEEELELKEVGKVKAVEEWSLLSFIAQ